MSFDADMDYLRAEMSPAVVEQLVHDWADQLRELRREWETKAGPGVGKIEFEQTVKGGHVVETHMQPPKRRYGKRTA